MARAIEVPVVVKKGSLSRSIEGEANAAMRRLGGSSRAVQPLGRMMGKIRADADEFTKSIEASNARVIAFGASVAVINGVSRAFKELVSTTIRVEKTLTDINVVLNTSQANLQKFGDGLFRVAKNTAQSFETVSEAALEFSRQGLSMEETLKRTNDALILTRLTGLKAADSVKGLTAAVNGFAKAGLTTTQIINKLAAVDVQFAVGTDDLIAGLSRAGAVAQDAGVSFDELVAMVTVAQQKTARGGAVIGNAFKTIYTRLQDPRALQALREVGVAVDDLAGAALPANTVLTSLAKTYDTLTRTQKASIDQMVAGKFQINILKAALGDLGKANSDYARAQQVSVNATDQAIQKNKQLNTTSQALATQTGIAVEELTKKIGDITVGPGIKNLLTTVNSLVESMTKGLSGETVGAKFAKGLLRGIGGILTGPGLIIVGGVFIKLFKDLVVFGAKSLHNLLGLNNAAKQQAAIQAGIGQLLAKNVGYETAMAAAAGNVTKQQGITNAFLTQEVALRQKAVALMTAMGAGAMGAGFRVSGAGAMTNRRIPKFAPSLAPTAGGSGGSGGVPNLIPSAEGGVPNFMMPISRLWSHLSGPKFQIRKGVDPVIDRIKSNRGGVMTSILGTGAEIGIKGAAMKSRITYTGSMFNKGGVTELPGADLARLGVDIKAGQVGASGKKFDWTKKNRSGGYAIGQGGRYIKQGGHSTTPYGAFSSGELRAAMSAGGKIAPIGGEKLERIMAMDFRPRGTGATDIGFGYRTVKGERQLIKSAGKTNEQLIASARAKEDLYSRPREGGSYSEQIQRAMGGIGGRTHSTTHASAFDQNRYIAEYFKNIGATLKPPVTVNISSTGRQRVLGVRAPSAVKIDEIAVEQILGNPQYSANSSASFGAAARAMNTVMGGSQRFHKRLRKSGLSPFDPNFAPNFGPTLGARAISSILGTPMKSTALNPKNWEVAKDAVSMRGVVSSKIGQSPAAQVITDVANRYRKGAQVGVPIELLWIEMGVTYGIQAVKNAFKMVGNVAKRKPLTEGMKFSLPADRPWKGMAGNMAPTFSPISDAISREKSQVGQLMGISPSSVQTRVVQNAALRSSFNPQGFGVISPTVGQSSFADAARMHRGQDLRTANLPNFATEPPKSWLQSLAEKEERLAGMKGRIAERHAMLKVEIAAHSEAAKRTLTEATAKGTKIGLSSAFKVHETRAVKMATGRPWQLGPAPTTLGGVAPAPRALTMMERVGGAGKTALGSVRSGASAVGRGAGSLLTGPVGMGLFMAPMLDQMVKGFLRTPTASERFFMTPEQRMAAGEDKAKYEAGTRKAIGGMPKWMGGEGAGTGLTWAAYGGFGALATDIALTIAAVAGPKWLAPAAAGRVATGVRLLGGTARTRATTAATRGLTGADEIAAAEAAVGGRFGRAAAGQAFGRAGTAAKYGLGAGMAAGMYSGYTSGARGKPYLSDEEFEMGIGYQRERGRAENEAMTNIRQSMAIAGDVTRDDIEINAAQQAIHAALAAVSDDVTREKLSKVLADSGKSREQKDQAVMKIQTDAAMKSQQKARGMAGIQAVVDLGAAKKKDTQQQVASGISGLMMGMDKDKQRQFRETLLTERIIQPAEAIRLAAGGTPTQAGARHGGLLARRAGMTALTDDAFETLYPSPSKARQQTQFEKELHSKRFGEMEAIFGTDKVPGKGMKGLREAMKDADSDISKALSGLGKVGPGGGIVSGKAVRDYYNDVIKFVDEYGETEDSKNRLMQFLLFDKDVVKSGKDDLKRINAILSKAGKMALMTFTNLVPAQKEMRDYLDSLGRRRKLEDRLFSAELQRTEVYNRATRTSDEQMNVLQSALNVGLTTGPTAARKIGGRQREQFERGAAYQRAGVLGGAAGGLGTIFSAENQLKGRGIDDMLRGMVEGGDIKGAIDYLRKGELGRGVLPTGQTKAEQALITKQLNFLREQERLLQREDSKTRFERESLQIRLKLIEREEKYLHAAVEAARTVTSRQAAIGREGRVAGAEQGELLSRRGILAEKSPFMTISQRRDFDLQTKLSDLGYQKGELKRGVETDVLGLGRRFMGDESGFSKTAAAMVEADRRKLQKEGTTGRRGQLEAEKKMYAYWAPKGASITTTQGSQAYIEEMKAKIAKADSEVARLQERLDTGKRKRADIPADPRTGVGPVKMDKQAVRRDIVQKLMKLKKQKITDQENLDKALGKAVFADEVGSRAAVEGRIQDELNIEDKLMQEKLRRSPGARLQGAQEKFDRGLQGLVEGGKVTPAGIEGLAKEFRGSIIDLGGDEATQAKHDFEELLKDLKQVAETHQIKLSTIIGEESWAKQKRQLEGLKDVANDFGNAFESAMMKVSRGGLSASQVLRGFAVDFLGAINARLIGNLADQVAAGFYTAGRKATGKQKGGVINAQNGMYVSGNRTGDRNLALLEDGEYVLNKKFVNQVGKENLDRANFSDFPRFQDGGQMSVRPGEGSNVWDMGLGFTVPRSSRRSGAKKDIRKALKSGQINARQAFQFRRAFGMLDGVWLTGMGSEATEQWQTNIAFPRTSAAGNIKRDAKKALSKGIISSKEYGVIKGIHGFNVGGFFSDISAKDKKEAQKEMHVALNSSAYDSNLSGFAFANDPQMRRMAAFFENRKRERWAKEAEKQAEQDAFVRQAATTAITMAASYGMSKLGSKGSKPKAGEAGFSDSRTAMEQYAGGNAPTAAPKGPGFFERNFSRQAFSAAWSDTKAVPRTMWEASRSQAEKRSGGGEKGPSLAEILESNTKRIKELETMFNVDTASDSRMTYETMAGNRGRREGLRGRSSGGYIDNIPAMLTGGEYVMNRNAVQKYGTGYFNKINRMQEGGMVGDKAFDQGDVTMGGGGTTTNHNNVGITVNFGKDTNPEVKTVQSGAEEDPRAFATKIRTAVLNVINEEQRVGGRLRNQRKGRR